MEAPMIVVREVFQLKFGKAKEAKAALKKFSVLRKKHGLPEDRVLTDYTGPYYTLILENTFENLAAFEQSLKSEIGLKEFGKWYHSKFVPLVDSGRREIYSVVE
jgi:hypothetical protein